LQLEIRTNRKTSISFYWTLLSKT